MAFSVLSIPKRIHKTFSSLRTGVILLILIGIAARAARNLYPATSDH